jgi:hypothetical protein
VLPAPRLAAAPVTLAAMRFAHAANTLAKLEAACAAPDDEVNVLEADVCLARGAASSATLCVLAHAPGDPHDATLADLLRAARAAGKGVKLDVKEWAALAPALAQLQRADAEAEDDGGGGEWRAMRLFRAAIGTGSGGAARAAEASFDVPAVIVNADVLTATGPPCCFNEQCRALTAPGAQVAAAAAVVETVGRAVPLALVSLGWSTAGEGGEYSAAHVGEMAAAAEAFAGAGVAVTFAVRASYVRRSWPRLCALLERFPAASLTVWSNVALACEEERWLRAELPNARVAWDCPPPLGKVGPLAAPLAAEEGGGGSPRRAALGLLAAAALGALFGAALALAARAARARSA